MSVYKKFVSRGNGMTRHLQTTNVNLRGESNVYTNSKTDSTINDDKKKQENTTLRDSEFDFGFFISMKMIAYQLCMHNVFLKIFIYLS